MNPDLFNYKYFAYVRNFAVPLNGRQQITILIDTDADFELFYLVGNRTDPRLTVFVTEGGAGGIGWSNGGGTEDRPNFDNVFGTAQLPFPVGLIPQLLPKKRLYSIELVDSSGAINAGQIAFVGFKRYPKSPEELAALAAEQPEAA